jgi:hypothetical protein
MADENQQQTESGSKPAEFIADMDTMTVTGMTLGAQLQQMRDDGLALIGAEQEKVKTLESQSSELQGRIATDTVTLAARNREIEALHETIANKNSEIDSMKMDLGVARMLVQQMKASEIPQKLERLENGGIRLAVTLDEDEAIPYLSQADSAGEEPAAFISNLLHEAIVAFNN